MNKLSKTYRASIIGDGPLSLSIAGQMAERGCLITYIDISNNENIYEKLSADRLIQFSGDVEFSAPLMNVTKQFNSVEDADIIAITVSSSHYDFVFEKILPYIRENQHIVFFPGCFGAITFKNRLQKEKTLSGITISEAVSFPYVCDLLQDGKLFVHSMKRKLMLSVCPKAQQAEMLSMYNGFFDIFAPAKNFLETSMDNINMVLHPLPIMLNLGSVEQNQDSFRHYIDGFTKSVGRLIQRMDDERLAVGAAYDLQLNSTLDQLKSYYGNTDATIISEYVQNPDGPYTNVKGFGLDSRYIIEDIPYLVVATVCLAGMLGVPTPTLKLCVDLANCIMDKDYYAIGNSLYKLGFDGMDKEEILEAVENLNMGRLTQIRK